MRRAYNFTPTPVDRRTLKSSVSNDPGDCCCCASPLDATSLENGYPTTEELVCSAVSEERVCNSCATCISHTISHGPTQPSIHLRLVQEIRAERVNLHPSLGTLHKVGDELDYRLDICRVTRGANIESVRGVYKRRAFLSTGVSLKF
jgi:hypothetical protein